MKVFILLTTLATLASAKPQIFYSGWPYGLTYSAPQAWTYSAPAPVVTYTAVPVATKTQYHAQDELGQASWGYAHPGQAHSEVRDAFGGVRGSYAYIAPDGRELRTEYVADAVNGFRVASNALPVGPAVPAAPALIGPAPVQDTPEVAAARSAHFKAIDEARARNAEADKKDAADAASEAEPDKKAEEPASARRKRDLIATYAAPTAILPTHHAITYTAAAPLIAHAPILAAPAAALRPAKLTTVINNPGHAVSYRID